MTHFRGEDAGDPPREGRSSRARNRSTSRSILGRFIVSIWNELWCIREHTLAPSVSARLPRGLNAVWPIVARPQMFAKMDHQD